MQGDLSPGLAKAGGVALVGAMGLTAVLVLGWPATMVTPVVPSPRGVWTAGAGSGSLRGPDTQPRDGRTPSRVRREPRVARSLPSAGESAVAPPVTETPGMPAAPLAAHVLAGDVTLPATVAPRALTAAGSVEDVSRPAPRAAGSAVPHAFRRTATALTGGLRRAF